MRHETLFGSEDGPRISYCLDFAGHKCVALSDRNFDEIQCVIVLLKIFSAKRYISFVAGRANGCANIVQ